MAKIKIRGERSLETKLLRLACDMREDARRLRTDYADRGTLANSLDDISRLISNTADAMRRS